ncbi:MAG: hypothetical protein HY894_01080 [Deltaproteobacteria bacterium]|nr:hypothetical protein [Deltaproteobacteria bacterium]
MAGYDIIEELGELAVDNAPLEAKLNRAAALFLDAYPFDQCSIYLWNRPRRLFELKGCAGTEASRVEEYGENNGVPGAARWAHELLILSKKDPGAASFDLDGARVEDAGSVGFRNAVAAPLRDTKTLYGVLYLKAAGRARLGAEKTASLRAEARQAVLIIKCADLIARHRKIHGEFAELQAKLLNSEKIMALADMAANLAHELKNPLLSIGGLAARVKKHISADSPGRPYLEQITHETGRLEKIINGALRSLKESAAELQPDDLNEIVAESLDIFMEEAGEHGIGVVRNFQKGAVPVMADREQLKIAFDNLIANALQSMENGGTLTVSTSRDKDAAIVKVADSGGGIDPRHVGHIFNPFFTTKKQGTGLGLPITNSIVMRHRGVIEVNNNVGVGVTFTVKLHSGDMGKAA